MDETRWSDRALREYVRRAHDHNWFSDSVDTEREAATARFRHEVRQRIVPVVQARLLEKVGTVTDPEGISYVADDLVDDCCREDERRWLMVSPEPWDFLAAWIASDIASSYKKAAGARQPDAKVLKRLAKYAKPTA